MKSSAVASTRTLAVSDIEYRTEVMAQCQVDVTQA